MARPAPGSLAARTELRNPLSIFKKSGSGRDGLSKGAGGGSVGEVTIEIDPDDNADGDGGNGGGGGARRQARAPAKASPLVDYDSGPSASPSLTLSPTSSPVPAPSTPLQHPSPIVTVSGLPLASEEEPSPKSEGTTATVGGGRGSHMENSATPVSTEANVVLRRQSGSAPKTPLPPYVNLSASSSDDLKKHIIRNSRRNKRASLGNGEVGRLLKAALNDYFERKKNGQQSNGSPALDSYVAEVFGALDYHKRGTVSREDFDTLCEIIGISASPPPSHRNSGLEWLSSYRPRPTSPAAASPIRVDRLGEVKYRRPLYEPRPEPPSSFLFTLGPRPFWELWPQKKRRRKRLTVDDFKKCLLEQWAKNRGIPQSRISTVLPVHFMLPSAGQVRKVNAEDRIDSARVHRNGVQFAAHAASEDSKSKKAMRRLVRVTRKYQALDRISEKLEDRLGRRGNFVRNGSLNNAAANPRPCPIHSNQATSSSSSLAGRSWSLRHRRSRRRRPVVICSPHCPDLGGGGEEHPPPVFNGRERVRRIESLEEQLRFQEAEISTLKDEVDGLRSSLQISDAQNLALQVLLRKVARGGEGDRGADTPTTTTANGKGNSGSLRLNGVVSAMSAEEEAVIDPLFRSQRKDDNEKQLENLVKELKEMSKIRYPNIGNNKQQSSSSNNSCNGAAEDDFGMTVPLPTPPPPPGTGRFPSTFQFRTAGANTSKGEDTVDGSREQVDVAEAYRALERAQEELNKMR